MDIAPGWRMMLNARKAHYFKKDARSLCGCWLFLGKKGPDGADSARAPPMIARRAAEPWMRNSKNRPPHHEYPDCLIGPNPWVWPQAARTART